MALVFDATLGTVTNTATLTTSSAAASGSRVFLFVWWYTTPSSLCTGVTGGGLTWVVDHHSGAAVIPGDAGSHLAIVSADAPSGLASSTVLTPSFSSSVDFGPGMAAHSWTGVGTGASGYLDATTTLVDDFSESWTTNNLVTTTANTLLIAFSLGPAASQTHTAIANYDERHDWTAEGQNRCAVVSRVVTSAATYNPGGTWVQTVNMQANIGAAYEQSSGPPPTYEPELVYHTTGARWS